MLFKAGILLLLVWLLGIVGAYNLGDVVLVLLLGGLMLLLLALLRARDAGAARREPR